MVPGSQNPQIPRSGGRIGAIYPDDAWVDAEAAALVEDFRRFMPNGVELVSSATPIAAEDATVPSAVRLALHISGLERQLDKPVLTANQVTSWHALRLIGVEAKLKDRGRLFEVKS